MRYLLGAWMRNVKDEGGARRGARVGDATKKCSLGARRTKTRRPLQGNGGLTREHGDRFRDAVLSRDGTAEALDLCVGYRVQAPYGEHLLKRRGLTTPR